MTRGVCRLRVDGPRVQQALAARGGLRHCRSMPPGLKPRPARGAGAAGLPRKTGRLRWPPRRACDSTRDRTLLPVSSITARGLSGRPTGPRAGGAACGSGPAPAGVKSWPRAQPCRRRAYRWAWPLQALQGAACARASDAAGGACSHGAATAERKSNNRRTTDYGRCNGTNNLRPVATR